MAANRTVSNVIFFKIKKCKIHHFFKINTQIVYQSIKSRQKNGSSVTHVMLRMTGFDVTSELQNQYGRSDVIVRLPDAVYIFELKMDKGRGFDEVSDEALRQIDENGYSDRFTMSGKSTRKIALVFSSDAKGLLGWRENMD